MTSKKTATTLTALLGATAAVDAGISYFGTANEFTVNLANSPFDWDIDGNNNADTQIRVGSFGGPTYLRVTIGRTLGTVTTPGSKRYVSNQAIGVTVDYAGNNAAFITAPAYWIFNATTLGLDFGLKGFTEGDTGFIGFVFTSNLSGNNHNGWAQVSFTTTPSVSITVHQWAYQDIPFNQPGGTIQVGEGIIPEPGTTAIGLGALALGAAGLRRWRARKVA